MDNGEIIFRKVKPDEAALYRQIRLESLESYPDHFCSDLEEQKSLPKLAFENFIAHESADKFIVGAFRQDELFGICGFFRQSQHRSEHRGEIIQMYVRPAYQGRKIGQRLLQKTMEEANQLPGLEQLELGVLTNSAAAMQLYENAEFKEYGLQKNFLKTGNGYLDQRLMVRKHDRPQGPDFSE